ncbi:unnamed protein product [Mytilus coruscus]|uniref:Uncharacterized protein n=1 Tax=Mytilus coruscus TaxID=42192 RepID=A0A6J8ESM2_MYTCO|nr:unnamed protein product [Mytilus coruscus]
MEEHTVIENQRFLLDTPSDTSPSNMSWRNIVVSINTNVGVQLGEKVLGVTVLEFKHRKDAEDIRNVTKPSHTNEGGFGNAKRNQTSQENAQDIRNKTQFTYTNYSSINTCLGIAFKDFQKKLPNDTFAYEEVCTIGSEFVKKTCGIGQGKSESSHVCEKCTDGSILPSFCFCDKTVHCVKDKELNSRAADD